MGIDKSYVFRTVHGDWIVQGYTLTGRLYYERFGTWREALDYANQMANTFEVPAVMPDHHAPGFSEWKIRPGINIRTNHHAATIVNTVGKGRQLITDIDEALDLAKALLSAVLQIQLGATDA